MTGAVPMLCGAAFRRVTPIVGAEAARMWSAAERLAFFGWIAGEPEAGAVIPEMGKRGGARVIYFCRVEEGELCMRLVYPKAEKDTISGHILKAIRKEIEDDITQVNWNAVFWRSAGP